MLEVNEQGRRHAAVPTLFYLPHCEAAFTNNLLEANLRAGVGGDRGSALANVAILGNRFSGYAAQQELRGRGDGSAVCVNLMVDCCTSGSVHEIAVPGMSQSHATLPKYTDLLVVCEEM